MTFEIWKTSDIDERPCENAKLVKDEITQFGYHRRQFVIDINTLEELMELIEKTERKRVVLFPRDDSSEDLPGIEVYDTYRE